MALRRFAYAVLGAAGLLAGAAGGALADDDSMRLSGGVRLAPELEAIMLSAPDFETAADEAASGTAQEPGRRSRPAGQAAMVDSHTATALPWHQRFTVAPSEPHRVWGSRAQEFQLQAGGRWGVTLGYTELERAQDSIGLEDFSAGAFFDLSSRVRLGGQVRFTSPEEEIFGEEGENRVPVIRFESAFRF